MREMPHSEYTWTLIEKRTEVPLVQTLILKANTVRPSFIAGQYLTVKIPHFEPREGKSYSISSIPQDEHIAITIKSMGDFSQALLALNVGNTITTDAPYGFFYPEEDGANDLVFVAGGIGITPCMSIIKNLLKTEHVGSVTLFYSNQTQESTLFKNDLDALAEEYQNFLPHYFYTRETAVAQNSFAGRMSGEKITELLNGTADRADFFICGSIDFTKTLWTSLRDAGVPSTQLYTEGFF